MSPLANVPPTAVVAGSSAAATRGTKRQRSAAGARAGRPSKRARTGDAPQTSDPQAGNNDEGEGNNRENEGRGGGGGQGDQGDAPAAAANKRAKRKKQGPVICSFCQNHPRGQAMHRTNPCNWTVVRGKYVLECQNCADHRYELVCQAQADMDQARADLEAAEQELEGAQSQLERQLAEASRSIAKMQRGEAQKQKEAAEQHTCEIGRKKNVWKRYATNHPTRYGDFSCDNCKAKGLSNICDADPFLGLKCTSCVTARGAGNCCVVQTTDGPVTMAPKPNLRQGFPKWFRQPCDICRNLTKKKGMEGCSWLTDRTSWDRPCGRCSRNNMTCLKSGELVQSQSQAGQSNQSHQSHHHHQDMAADVVAPPKQWCNTHMLNEGWAECRGSTPFRKNCQLCLEGKHHCRAVAQQITYSCAMCFQMGLVCRDAGDASKIYPLYDFSRVGVGNFCSFSRCTKCRENNRNCDRQRPCDSCVKHEGGDKCDKCDSLDESINCIKRLQVPPGPLYYLALGYGADGVDDVKDGSKLEHWIGPFFDFYAVDKTKPKRKTAAAAATAPSAGEPTVPAARISANKMTLTAIAENMRLVVCPKGDPPLGTHPEVRGIAINLLTVHHLRRLIQANWPEAFPPNQHPKYRETITEAKEKLLKLQNGEVARLSLKTGMKRKARAPSKRKRTARRRTSDSDDDDDGAGAGDKNHRGDGDDGDDVPPAHPHHAAAAGAGRNKQRRQATTTTTRPPRRSSSANLSEGFQELIREFMNNYRESGNPITAAGAAGATAETHPSHDLGPRAAHASGGRAAGLPPSRPNEPTEARQRSGPSRAFNPGSIPPVIVPQRQTLMSGNGQWSQYPNQPNQPTHAPAYRRPDQPGFRRPEQPWSQSGGQSGNTYPDPYENPASVPYGDQYRQSNHPLPHGDPSGNVSGYRSWDQLNDPHLRSQPSRFQARPDHNPNQYPNGIPDWNVRSAQGFNAGINPGHGGAWNNQGHQHPPGLGEEDGRSQRHLSNAPLNQTQWTPSAPSAPSRPQGNSDTPGRQPRHPHQPAPMHGHSTDMPSSYGNSAEPANDPSGGYGENPWAPDPYQPTPLDLNLPLNNYGNSAYMTDPQQPDPGDTVNPADIGNYRPGDHGNLPTGQDLDPDLGQAQSGTGPGGPAPPGPPLNQASVPPSNDTYPEGREFGDTRTDEMDFIPEQFNDFNLSEWVNDDSVLDFDPQQ